jgi:hypothetical protein
MGQTATSWGVCVTAALPLKAEVRLRCNICRKGPILLQKSLSSGLTANSRNIRLWTDVSLNPKCAWIAKFGIFFSAQTPKIFLQQYRPLAPDHVLTADGRYRELKRTCTSLGC